MRTSRRHHRGAVVVALVAVVVAALTVATSVSASRTSEMPAWKKALLARSDALNRSYGLGTYAGTGARSHEVSRGEVVVASSAIALAARTDMPAWEKALMARSDALNRYYGLGKYVATRTRSIGQAAMPAWKRALIARSDALNRHHKLGAYAGS